LSASKQISFDGVHRVLTSLFGDCLHAKRILSLAGATLGAIQSASLAVALIGQGLALARGRNTKYAIKQVDRLLSNAGIDVDTLLARWVAFILGDRPEIAVALDWTEFNADGQATLMLSLLTRHGRATPLYWLTVDSKTLKGRRNAYEYQVLVRFAAALPDGMAPYLARNAAVAVALTETVTAPQPPVAVAGALAHAALPGRAEMLEGDPPAIADAAHNEAGARALAEALPALAAGRPVFGCLSVLADKDAAAIAAALAPALDGCVCTAADPGPAMGRPGSRAMEAAELARLVEAAGIAVEVEADPAAAVSRTSALARERGGVALFAGSHYLLRYVWNARHAQNSSR